MKDTDLQPEEVNEQPPKETDQAPAGRTTLNRQGENTMKGHVPQAGATARFKPGRIRHLR